VVAFTNQPVCQDKIVGKTNQQLARSDLKSSPRSEGKKTCGGGGGCAKRHGRRFKNKKTIRLTTSSLKQIGRIGLESFSGIGSSNLLMKGKEPGLSYGSLLGKRLKECAVATPVRISGFVGGRSKA